MSSMLEVKGLTVNYGAIRAVDNLSLSINEGEVVSVIGANGAGKSTTLNTISGLLRTQTGGISFLGKDISKTPAHRLVEMGLAQVPEGRRIFLNMTVRENLELGAFTRVDQTPEVLEKDLEKIYGLFPRLGERHRQVAGTLSGGEQQMLAMARGLMCHPRLLMLDEPSMGLAPILVEEIFSIIADLHAQGATILLVEQNARMALSIADRGYVLETGKIVTTGTGRDLLNSPDIKKAYLGG